MYAREEMKSLQELTQIPSKQKVFESPNKRSKDQINASFSQIYSGINELGFHLDKMRKEERDKIEPAYQEQLQAIK